MKELLTSVEVWDKNIGWQSYDCPDGDTVEAYIEFARTETSDYWATLTDGNDKLRLNGKHIVTMDSVTVDDLVSGV